MHRDCTQKFGLLHPYGHDEPDEYMMRVALRGGKVAFILPATADYKAHGFDVIHPLWRRKDHRRAMQYMFMRARLFKEYFPMLRGNLYWYYYKWYGDVLSPSVALRRLFLETPSSIALLFAGRAHGVARILGFAIGLVVNSDSTDLGRTLSPQDL